MTQALRLGKLPELLLNTACSAWQGFAGHSSFLLRVEELQQLQELCSQADQLLPAAGAAVGSTVKILPTKTNWHAASRTIAASVPCPWYESCSRSLI